ncbi:MAG: helix-turn-helix domain-containing protein [Candidatus Methylacidiphilales bacterium]|nr:helix-turn-helix transcriptional regulator [Candidatus Methylacidiphilales bacterium]
MSDILTQLKSLRQQREMNQSKLGEKLGLPQSHISKIEQGATDPRLSTVQDLARVLDHELMLVPRELVSVVRATIHGEGEEERRFQPDETENT